MNWVLNDNEDFNHGEEGVRYVRCASICHVREGQSFNETDIQNAGRGRGKSWQLRLEREQFFCFVLFFFLQKIIALETVEESGLQKSGKSQALPGGGLGKMLGESESEKP